MKAPYAADMMNSMSIALLQDDIFMELEAIVPEGDLQILVEDPEYKDWDAIEHILLNGDHACPKFLWTNDPS